MIICPICKNPLSRNKKTYFCECGHSFDISSSGYCNLLIRNKSGDWIGDNKNMVNARRAFLDSGTYQSLRDAVCNCASSLLPDNSANVVDSGCGEGYYTRAVAEALSDKNLTIVGMDISKSATQYAAKRDKITNYITASCFQMPIADSSADLVLSLFAPSAPSEFFRILKPGGKVIQVVPGAKHLWELKRAVYERPYLNQEDKHTLEGFKLIDRQRVNYKSEISSHEQIMALFSMTPYCHRTPKEGLEKLEKLEYINLTMSFLILTFEKEL